MDARRVEVIRSGAMITRLLGGVPFLLPFLAKRLLFPECRAVKYSLATSVISISHYWV